MKKKILILVLVLLMTPTNFLAQDALYDTETGLPTDSTTICSNKEYTFVQEQGVDRALVFLDGNNNYLASKIINQTEAVLTFPSDLVDVQILVSKVEDSQIDYSQMYKVNYTIEDCGYEDSEDSYEQKENLLIVDYANGNFNASYEGANTIKYQIKDSKIIKTLPQEGIKVEVPSIVQIEVDLDEGKEKYYEIELINDEDYIVREVSTLQTREIKVNSFLSFKSILFLSITFILYLYFRIKIKKLKKIRRRQLIRKRNLSRKDKKMYKKEIKRK